MASNNNNNYPGLVGYTMPQVAPPQMLAYQQLQQLPQVQQQIPMQFRQYAAVAAPQNSPSPYVVYQMPTAMRPGPGGVMLPINYSQVQQLQSQPQVVYAVPAPAPVIYQAQPVPQQVAQPQAVPQPAKKVELQPDDFVTSITFSVNGQSYTVDNVDPTVTLNDWIRSQPGLTGTKKSCGEGGCGACAVIISWNDAITGQPTNISVNSCLRPLAAVNGASITTIEGLGSVEGGMNLLQERLAMFSGTQCGFCTPGMIMRMYNLLQSNPNPTPEDVEAAFDGNLCRCTGYRPILDTFKSFCGNTSDIEDLVGKTAKLSTKSCAGICAPKKQCAKESTNGCGGCCSKQQSCGTKDKKKLRLEAKVTDTSSVVFFDAATLTDIFNIFTQYSGSAIKLIVGNTSVGIYKNVPVDVYVNVRGVSALTAFNIDPTNGITIGSASTITEFIELLQQALAANTTYQTSGIPAMIKHLYRLANFNVRNIGSLAGNLMLAHGNQYFPSDLFIVLMGVGATFTVATSATATVSVPASQFINYDMTNQVLVSITVPYLQQGETLEYYKVALRHANAHSFVNAGFKVQLDANSNVLSQPIIAYGGVGPYTYRASNTEQYLVGKSLTDPATLSGALPILAAEMVAQGPLKTQYRQSLVFSYFYKWYLSSLPSSSVQSQYATAAEPFVRPVSTGSAEYSTDPAQYPVSEAIPKLEGTIQCTGEALYVDDIPLPSNALHAAYVLSTVAVGDIASIDASAALAATGVVAFISAADIPKNGTNNIQWDWLLPQDPIFQELLFANTSVVYAGQPVGLIVADTAAHASAAALLVNVTYTNTTTPLLTIQDAIAANSFWPQEIQLPPITQGDLNSGFAASDVVFSGDISCGSQYHFHLETQTSLAIPGDDGTMLMYSSTQFGQGIQTMVAKTLGLTAAKVTCVTKRVGGAYGAKLTRCIPPACAAAVAAWKLRRPVKLVMDITSNMSMLGKRDEWYATYKVGANNNGQINALQLNYYNNAGAVLDGGALIMMLGMQTSDNVYNFPNFSVTGYSCLTNIPGTTFMRGPGTLPAIFVAEQIMEQTALELNLPADQVREVNFYQPGQLTPYQQPLPYFNIPKIWTQLKASADWDTRVAAVQAYNSANRWTKQGIAITPCKYGIQWNAQNFHVMVSIFSDGSVQISCGGIEMGQGLNTKVAQVCAQTLGIPMSFITVTASSTEKTPNSAMTGGSIGSDLNCVAVIQAAETLKQRLSGIQSLFLKDNLSWQELIAKAVAAGIDLQATGWANKTVPYVYTYNSYGAAVSQVQVDVLTGEVQVLRSDILFDCGVSINPAIDLGQTIGAFIQGLGYFLTEEIAYDPTNPGVLLTNGTWEYKPPCSTDIPIDLRVTLLKDAPNPLGVVNSKASGEPPLTLSASIFFAVKNAIASARSDAGLTGYFPFYAPATVDNIQQTTGTANSQLSL